MNPAQIDALRRVAAVVLDVVRDAGPLGAPGGVLYAALMAHGCSLQQFEGIMGGLVRAHLLRKDGECYHVVEAVGPKMAARRRREAGL